MFSGVEDNALTRYAGRMAFIAPVERTYKPGCRQDTILVLMSRRQGTGKSTFIRSLAGPFADTLFSDSLDMGESRKEKWEAVGNAAVVEAGELQGWAKADITRLKNFITRRTDRLRPAYGRKTIAVPRRFALFASTNDTAPIPNDPSGARRFLVVEVERGNAGPPEEAMLEPCNDAGDSLLAQCYAEAVEAVEGGSTANMHPSLHELHQRNGQRYRDADEAVEEPLGAFLDGIAIGGHTTLKEATAAVGDGVSTGRIAKALRNAGWVSCRTRKARVWKRG